MASADLQPATVRELIVEHLAKRDVPAELITDAASFTGDLAIDSLDLHALAIELEDEFGVVVSQRDATRLTTVGDAIAFVVQARAGSIA